MLSMVDWAEVWSEFSVVGTIAVWGRLGAEGGFLCLCFHLVCPFSDRSSQKAGVGSVYVGLCFAGWSIIVPCSAYHSALSVLDRSSQWSGFGG